MKKVLSFVKAHHMIERGDHILAAVSGGADSVCLLLVLLKLKEILPIKLSAVHVEHGIRGEASRADAAFVKALCEKKGIPCVVCECDAVTYARERGMGLEEGARALRYEQFEACRQAQKADKIAVAHNQNDCAETVLFHLARGTGLKGLQGIFPVRGQVIRPLLCMSRGEIEAYLQEQGQAYCTDATNQELLYSRNKLRHQVLPVLEEINTRATEHIYQTAGYVSEVWELIERQVGQARQRWVKDRPGGSQGPEPADNQEEGLYFQEEGLYFLEEGILQEPPLIQRTLVLELLGDCAGSRKDLANVHTAQVLELLGHQVGRRISLPYGIRALRTYGGILLGRDVSRENEGPGSQGPEAECNLPVMLGEMQELPQYERSIFCRRIEKKVDFQEIPKNKYTKWFDYDRIKSGLQVRNPKPQDYLTIDGQGRRQSLKRYFVNQKIPAGQRGRQLVLADGAHILWVIGYRISEAYKVTDSTRHILEVRIENTINGGRIHERED